MTDTRTSDSDPIRVDWLPTQWPGKIGLTFAPGKKQQWALSGPWDRSLDADLRRLREAFGTSRLVSLIEDHEMAELGISNLVDAAAEVGIAVARLPIGDGEVPEADQAFLNVVREIAAWASAGEHVVIHCKGGLGRAGTMGGCVLIAGGLSSADALDALREARGPNCPETCCAAAVRRTLHLPADADDLDQFGATGRRRELLPGAWLVI